MALLTAQELSDYMSGIRMNNAQRRSADVILQGVQGELERHLHRPLEVRRAREMVRVDRSGYLNVRHTPVVAVLRLQNYGSTRPVISQKVENYKPVESDALPLYDYAPENNGAEIIVPGGIRYGTPGNYVLVEYISGGRLIFDALPQIKIAILRVAAREFTNMHDDTMSLRGTQAQAGNQRNAALPDGWTREELQKFDRLRRRIVA